MEKKIPEKVINRLTLYHYILQDYLNAGEKYISSAQVSSLLNIDDSQVRKDISILDNSGKSRIGYDVEELKTSIEKTLGFSKTKKAFIIGAGNLGMALAKYDNFANYGLNIIALFDNDRAKIGSTVNGRLVLDIKKLANLARKNNVDIAILTVPAKYAQQIANLIVESDIKYIWNFTPTVLCVPQNIQVWNENLMGSLLQFTYNI